MIYDSQTWAMKCNVTKEQVKLRRTEDKDVGRQKETRRT